MSPVAVSECHAQRHGAELRPCQRDPCRDIGIQAIHNDIAKDADHACVSQHIFRMAQLEHAEPLYAGHSTHQG